MYRLTEHADLQATSFECEDVVVAAGSEDSGLLLEASIRRINTRATARYQYSLPALLVTLF
jgi:hypothetical protein